MKRTSGNAVPALLITTILAVGCVSAPSVPASAVTTSKVAHFRIPVDMVGPDLSVERVVAAYARGVEKNTAYRAMSTKDGVTSGVSVAHSGSAVRVSYVRQAADRTAHNDFVAEFELDVQRAGSDHLVRVRCPDTVSNPYGAMGGAVWRSFIDKREALEDIERLCDRASIDFETTSAAGAQLRLTCPPGQPCSNADEVQRAGVRRLIVR